MIKNQWPYFLANEPQSPNFDLQVTDKYSGEVAANVGDGGFGND